MTSIVPMNFDWRSATNSNPQPSFSKTEGTNEFKDSLYYEIMAEVKQAIYNDTMNESLSRNMIENIRMKLGVYLDMLEEKYNL